jgi:hypothetical protein
MSEAKLKGSCVCGAVQFLVDDAFKYAAYCHCSRCRRRTGSAFSAFAGIESDRLVLSAGAEHLRKLGERPEQAHGCHCALCLCPLYHVVNAGTLVHVQLGALTDAPSKKPDHHIFVASKAPWHEIRDELPQWAGLPAG